jgi:hypothetical protein
VDFTAKVYQRLSKRGELVFGGHFAWYNIVTKGKRLLSPGSSGNFIENACQFKVMELI